MRKADDLQLAKHNMIFPPLLQSSERHDGMITEMSDELRVTLREEVWKVLLNSYVKNLFANDLAPVVQKVDRAIHWINDFSLSSAISFPILIHWIVIYPVDSADPTFETLGPDYFFFSLSVSKKTKLELSNERKMRHESGKDVSKQSTNN